MPLRVACPNPECRASYSVSEEYEGRPARCRACGQTFSVLGTNPDSDGDAGVEEIPMLPEPRVGAVFAGRYRVERRLGAGGMGAVFLARDTKLDRPVALKVPHFRAEEDPRLVRRFEREARIAAGFDHPNLCPVFDVGESGGAHYLTMPYIEGRPLSDLVAEGPIDLARAVETVRTIALALAEAHRKGVVHRDLKPSNVLMCPRRGPVVVDFGLARREGPDDSRLTRSGAVMGTPSYMAPEQIDGDARAIGPSTDVYALGVLLYELLTGELPFVGPLGSVLVQVKTTTPRPPSEVRPGIDPQLEQICLGAMAKAPGERIPSMEAMATALAAVSEPIRPGASDVLLAIERAAHDSIAGPRDSRAVGQDGEDPPRRRSTPWIGLAAAASLVVLGVAVKVRTDRGTVTLEIADPASVGIVMVDGRKIALEALGEPIVMTAGEHELEVTRRDFTVQTRRFQVNRGDEVAVTVSHEPTPTRHGPGEVDRDGQDVRLSFAGVRAGQERSDNGLDMAFCWCPAGTFTMGSPEGEPQRNPDEQQVQATLTKGFWLGKYEVTQEQYRRVMGTNPSHFASTGDGKEKVAGLDTSRFPVERVLWDEAIAFCREFTEQEQAAGRLLADWEYRLPTEAQWEYACRAGTTTATAFGDRLSSREANFNGSRPFNGAEQGPYLERPAVVGQYAPNRWGLHDMHGNVWEWCSDRYGETLPGGDDPTGPTSASDRVQRGGSWIDFGRYSRSAGRFEMEPGPPRYSSLGFRVAAVRFE